MEALRQLGILPAALRSSHLAAFPPLLRQRFGSVSHAAGSWHREPTREPPPPAPVCSGHVASVGAGAADPPLPKILPEGADGLSPACVQGTLWQYTWWVWQRCMGVGGAGKGASMAQENLRCPGDPRHGAPRGSRALCAPQRRHSPSLPHCKAEHWHGRGLSAVVGPVRAAKVTPGEGVSSKKQKGGGP